MVRIKETFSRIKSLFQRRSKGNRVPNSEGDRVPGDPDLIRWVRRLDNLSSKLGRLGYSSNNVVVDAIAKFHDDAKNIHGTLEAIDIGYDSVTITLKEYKAASSNDERLWNTIRVFYGNSETCAASIQSMRKNLQSLLIEVPKLPTEGLKFLERKWGDVMHDLSIVLDILYKFLSVSSLFVSCIGDGGVAVAVIGAVGGLVKAASKRCESMVEDIPEPVKKAYINIVKRLQGKLNDNANSILGVLDTFEGKLKIIVKAVTTELRQDRMERIPDGTRTLMVLSKDNTKRPENDVGEPETTSLPDESKVLEVVEAYVASFLQEKKVGDTTGPEDGIEYSSAVDE